MERVPGSFGTSVSFVLRIFQLGFSSASLISMCLDYNLYEVTTFCYLAVVMAYVILWSILHALADTYSVLVKQLPHKPRVLSTVLAGDVVLSFLSLSGACGAASATEMLLSIDAAMCGDSRCIKYQVSALLAFLCWTLFLDSAIFNLWSFYSLFY
ncbi:CASP-like protein 5C2 [Raphanus sativus]|uniref:CASP-like protein n=1 Tax=Raphanus sativus TaxID=3726 RepID=A0A6J0NF13_RAPSA|nr:CASP-like protein 5C2 [Raphanus sativus]KAJ4868309.1 CASP-like protein 5C2 [Raphanus sativus]